MLWIEVKVKLFDADSTGLDEFYTLLLRHPQIIYDDMHSVEKTMHAAQQREGTGIMCAVCGCHNQQLVNLI